MSPEECSLGEVSGASRTGLYEARTMLSTVGTPLHSTHGMNNSNAANVRALVSVANTAIGVLEYNIRARPGIGAHFSAISVKPLLQSELASIFKAAAATYAARRFQTHLLAA